MAIFHCEVKCIGRSNGRTASGSAAYRSGEKIRDNTGDIQDYTKKQGILYKEIILPDNAPYWASDRATLWNNVDKAETRKNSTVAREYEIALPAELNQDEQAKLSKVFARYLVNEYGIAADISIHAPRKNSNNYHAHILTSTRILEADGFGSKTRVLDSAKTGSIEIKKIRAVWEDLTNQALERNGIDERVSCESLKAQGIDREPQIHLGVAAAAMERRGIRTERSDHNRQIREREAEAKAAALAEFEQAAPMGATLHEASMVTEQPQKSDANITPQVGSVQSEAVSPSVPPSDPEEPDTQREKNTQAPIGAATENPMTRVKAKKIINSSAHKIYQELLSQYQKSVADQLDELQKIAKDDEQAYQKYQKAGKPLKGWFEGAAVYKKRVNDWEKEHNRLINNYNNAIEAIKRLKNPDEIANKEDEIWKRAMIMAVDENPKAYSVLFATSQEVKERKNVVFKGGVSFSPTISEVEERQADAQRDGEQSAPIGAVASKPPETSLQKGQWIMFTWKGDSCPMEVLELRSDTAVLQASDGNKLTFKLDNLEYRIMSNEEVAKKKSEREQRNKEQQEKRRQSQQQQRGRGGFER